MLSLREELIVLSLPDAEGKKRGSATYLGTALSGATIIELLLAQRVSMDAKKRLTVVDSAPLPDELLTEALARIAKSKRDRSVQHWIGDFSWALRNTRQRLLDRLVLQGIVREEPRKFLGIFRYRYYYLLDPAPATRLRDKLRAALVHGETPDNGTTLLISLLHASQHIGAHFDKPERKAARKRAAEIAKEQVVAGAVGEQIAAEIAVAVAVVIATTAATSAASN